MIQASGRHEIGVHGWIHERNATLPREEEERLLRMAVERLTELMGERPVGYRAPSWNFSDATLDLLLEMDFLYDSSLMADDRPYEINQNGEPTGLVELPVDWILDDAPLFNPLGDRYSNPRQVLEVYKDEFDVAYEEGTMFLLTMHPHYIGHRSRIVILRELIEHIRSKPGVWFGTHPRGRRVGPRPGPDAVAVMRITIRLNDDLMRAVKRHALEAGTTVPAVIVQALREQLHRHRNRTSNPPAPLSLVTTGEGGLLPGVDLDDSAAFMELMEGDA